METTVEELQEEGTVEGLPLLEDFDQFVGQEKLKARLSVSMQSALRRHAPMDHVLLSGPAGVGKSTMARLIANWLGDEIMTLVMPMERQSLTRALREFDGGILFLDEIHALSKRNQEILLPVLSSSLLVDDRGREIDMGWVTVIAATTERDKLIAPLHDRFPIKPEIEPYTDADLSEIVAGMADRIRVPLDEPTMKALGTASGGVPRNAEAFLLTARDLMVIREGTVPTVEEILGLCEVDPDGLTALHLRYLRVLLDQGGRAGQKTIEMLLQVPAAVLRESERLLMARGLIELLPSGRVLTPLGVARASNREVRKYERR